jgi:hypothetical protein
MSRATSPMWGSRPKIFCDLMHIDVVGSSEGTLAHLVLDTVVVGAKRQRPAVRRFRSDAAIGRRPDVSGLYILPIAMRDGADVAADPSKMGRTTQGPFSQLSELRALSPIQTHLRPHCPAIARQSPRSGDHAIWH